MRKKNFFQKQVLEFIPEPKYNEAKLYCAYEQFDESKNLLYEENDQHVQLSVTYVLDPYENMVNISQIRVSKHYITYNPIVFEG